MNIISAIYTAFIDYGHYKKNSSKEYTELVSAYSKTLDCLQASLSKEQEPLFFEAEAQRNLIAADDEENMFYFGFRTGAKLILEILSSDRT